MSDGLVPDPLGLATADALAEVGVAFGSPVDRRPALGNRADAGTTMDGGRTGATATLAAWCARLLLTVDADNRVLVEFDAWPPAPLTAAVARAGFLADVEPGPDYTGALAAAQAVLAAADVEAAVAEAIEHARTRERIARERRRRVAAEHAEQARRRAALGAALAVARGDRPVSPE